MDKIKCHRATFARAWDVQVLPVVDEVARAGITQAIQVANRNIKITRKVALFFINRPILRLHVLPGAAVAGSHHVSSHMGATAMCSMLEARVKTIPSVMRPELEEVDNQCEY